MMGFPFLPSVKVMSHQSLYRKYRPQRFSEVVGQGHATKTLQNAITEDRVAHAYLFSGPRGTGKTSTARILAKALNCTAPEGAEPCNKCSSCIEITEGSSLDVVEIDAASHGSVDDARDLRERVAYAPVGGRWRTYIIDECHMLSAAANNALLKVLEEPPGHVVFVFATTEPHKVLQTLLDRCQRYEFRAIGPSDLASHLAQVVEAEGITADDDVLSMVASRASGSARDALSLLDQLTSFAGPKVGFEDLSRLLGAMPDEVLFEAVDAISEHDVGAALSFADGLVRSGRDVREFLRLLIEHLRALFLIQHAQAPQEILDVPDAQLERLRAQSNHFTPAELLRLFDIAAEVHVALRQAVEGRLALEVGLARMARADLDSSPSALLQRIERLERTESRARPKESKDSLEPQEPEKAVVDEPSLPSEESVSESVVVEPGEIDIEKVQRAWPVMLEKVKKRKVTARAMLIAANPAAWRNGELILEFGPAQGFHRDRVSEASIQEPLKDAFFETFGVRPRIRCVLGETLAASKPDSKSESAAGGNGEATPGNPEPEASADYDSSGEPPSAIDLVRKGLGAEVVEEF
jgi:DNA polymerase III subunit gamma/tau